MRRFAEVVQEERRVRGRVERQLPVLDGQAHARQRAAHRARPRRGARRMARELAGLRLAVSVADPQPGRLVPAAEDVGVERLAGGHQPAQRFDPARPGAVGDHAVLRRRHAEHVHPLALGDLEPLGGVEASVVQQRRRPADPGRDEGVARRLRPARSGRAPDEVALLRGQPVLGLQALAREVALAVQHRFRLARGARGERDQARVAGAELGGRRDVARRQRAPRVGGDPHRRALPARGLEYGAVALVGDHERGGGDPKAQPQVLRAQLLRARQDRVAGTEAGDHREHPLRPVAEQREHDVAAPHALFRQVRVQQPGLLRDLAEAPLPPRAVARQLDDGAPLSRRGLDHVAREVHSATS
jgi:hypothetical protein